MKHILLSFCELGSVLLVAECAAGVTCMNALSWPQSVFMCHVIATTACDCLPVHSEVTGFCNRSGLCLLHGTV
jgi:hypothetical protein